MPATLAGCRLVALELSGMLAGAQYRGQFEQRMKAVLGEIVEAEGETGEAHVGDEREARGRILVFVDELHTILGAGGAEGAMDAASMLKPLLARGELRMVGATTMAEYRKIERDSALARRFRHVRRTLEKALTQAILDGRLPAESKVRANLGQDGEVALELPEPALAGAGQRR